MGGERRSDNLPRQAKDANLLGLVNTSYTIGAIVSGWFMGGPLSDFLGRRWGMGIGCLLTIVATFVQAFAPRNNIGCFIGGRVLIGIGQGIALSKSPAEQIDHSPLLTRTPPLSQLLVRFTSARSRPPTSAARS